MGVAVSAIERATEDVIALRLELEEQLRKCKRRKARLRRRRGGRPGFFGVDTTVLFGGETPIEMTPGTPGTETWDDAAEDGFSGHVGDWWTFGGD